MAYLQARHQFSTATSAPPTQDQLRLNAADQTLASLLWVTYESTDGADVGPAWRAVRTGGRIMLAAFDDAARNQHYMVTGDASDLGEFAQIPIQWDHGELPLLSQEVRAYISAQSPTEVPQGGNTGDVLSKLGPADFDTGWTHPTGSLQPPELDALRKWLGVSATVLDDAQLQQVLDAELLLQARACRMPADGLLSADLIQALYRRCARHVAARGHPLGMLGADSEFGPSVLARWDGEIDRLEGPSRVVVFG